MLQKRAGLWGNLGLRWCGWQADGSAPDENHFTVSRIIETGVLWRCLQSQKGYSHSKNMIPFVITLLILGAGWQAYVKARRDGTWFNKQFLITMLGALAVCAAISLGILLIMRSETTQKHEGLSLAIIFLAIAAGVTLITIYANRWKKREELKRAAQNRVIGLAIATFLLFAAGASAQTTYKDPGGNFTITVPAGWQAEMQQRGIGVQISKGEVSATVAMDLTNDGSTPQVKDVQEFFEKQFMQNCPTPDGAPKRGDATVAGLPGSYSQFVCKDQEHGQWMVMYAVATSKGKSLLFQLSLPASEYSGVKPVLDGMAKSLRVGSGSAKKPDASGWVQDPHTQGNTNAAGNAQKLQALEIACSSGVLTPKECAAKRAELTGGGGSSNSAANNFQLQALQRACSAGVFTPEECEAKRAALTGAGSSAGPSDDSAPPPALPNAQNVAGSSDNSNPPLASSAGNLYNDPQGAFRLMIPQGWTAETKSGCYGPPRSCPPNASGVYIKQGKSWAFVAPYSGKAKQPTDVVTSVAEEYQSGYQDFTVLQNEPSKYNGLDVAFGLFKGTGRDGVPVSLVVVGVVAPSGQYFVVASSVAQSDLQTVGAEMTTMLNTIRFAGQ